MGADMYVEMTGIKGDSADAAHKDWIEVDSYAHRIHQPAGAQASGRGGLRVDSASPTLALYCCTGKAVDKVVLELCRALGDKTTFMKYTLEQVMVTSVSPAGSSTAEDPLPWETVDLRYGIIRWEYTPTTAEGKKLAAVKAAWSAKENKSV
jgi:type VI secretion system secreted protein Hcp